MSSATGRVTARNPKRSASSDAVSLRDYAAIDFEPRPTFSLTDDDVRRRWERIALGDRA